VSTTWQTVHVRVNDAATGQPTPVRVRFADPAGEYFPPFGRLSHFATDMGVDVGGNVLIASEPHAYIDGTCEIRLPTGPLKVSIAKGPEYRPLTDELTLNRGKIALRFEMERWTDLRAERWYSGDCRSHFLTPHAALLEGAAEDVAVVNLLVWQSLIFGDHRRQYPAISNILAFSGQHPALELPGHMVVVNTMNLHEDLGRLLLLNCHRVVYPLTTAGPEGWHYWTLADWCDQCHRKGGLVVGDNFFGHYPGQAHGELLADVIMGKTDALLLGDFENPEADAQLKQESELMEWYWLLDCGFRVPLAGGSGKDSNLGVLGHPRTYARLEPGQEFNYQNWIEAVRAGRTFVTNGPLLFFTVNGQDPGAVITLSSSAQTVRVRAQARSLVPFRRLQVVANNRVVGDIEPAGSPACAVVESDVSLPAGGWLLARCWGEYDDALEQWIAAQTSPIYVEVEGHAPRADPMKLDHFRGHLDQMLEWAQSKARCQSEQQRQRLAGIFANAREILESRSERILGSIMPRDQ
jgi:hypothetical protein